MNKKSQKQPVEPTAKKEKKVKETQETTDKKKVAASSIAKDKVPKNVKKAGKVKELSSDSSQEEKKKKKSAKKVEEESKSDMKVVKPKRPTNALQFYFADVKEKMEKEHGIKGLSLMPLIGKSFQSLPAKEKAIYDKKAAQDKQRYEDQKKEMKDNGFFIMEDGQRSCDVFLIENYKGTLPKKPKLAFSYYFAENLQKVRDEQHITVPQAMALLSENFKKLTDKERKTYENKAAESRKEYEKHMEDIKEKGFFIMKDGQKSSDVPPKIKKKRVSKDNAEGVKRAKDGRIKATEAEVEDMTNEISAQAKKAAKNVVKAAKAQKKKA